MQYVLEGSYHQPYELGSLLLLGEGRLVFWGNGTGAYLIAAVINQYLTYLWHSASQVFKETVMGEVCLRYLR